MDRQYPIFTTKTQCQDCYKCVRECPVKAIRIENQHASIIPELCTCCGHCVQVCPAQAKSIRDDIGRARLLLQSDSPVIASIAPSWICEFPGIEPSAFIAALKQLGFAGAGETALGAQAVSNNVSRQLKQAKNGLFISSACPSVVEWIKKYQPHLTPNMTRLYSPLLAHCRLLREQLGSNIKIIFFGPCVAKKLEADEFGDLLNIALTFKDLRHMFQQAKIDPAQFDNSGVQQWLLESSQHGRLYPAEGGMLRTLTDTGNAELLSVSGVQNIHADISGIETIARTRPVFLEALACSGGCINGPATTHCRDAGLARKLAVFAQSRPGNQPPQNACSDLTVRYRRKFVIHPAITDSEITDALKRVDKHTGDDELNCSGCGYETCRRFAAAMLQGKAEPSMCVSYMRKKAQRKANALLRSIPSGIVIVDRQLQIIECNRPFVEMFDEDTRQAFESLDSLENADLTKIVPFADLFELALQTGNDICREKYLTDRKVLNLTIFSIQPGQIVGAVIQDVTEVQWQRQQIARNAREVLRRNLATVQDIAHKLGEHMADNEVLLNSIAYGYTEEIPENEQ